MVQGEGHKKITDSIRKKWIVGQKCHFTFCFSLLFSVWKLRFWSKTLFYIRSKVCFCSPFFTFVSFEWLYLWMRVRGPHLWEWNSAKGVVLLTYSICLSRTLVSMPMVLSHGEYVPLLGFTFGKLWVNDPLLTASWWLQITLVTLTAGCEYLKN